MSTRRLIRFALGLLGLSLGYQLALADEPFVRTSQYVASADGTRLAIDIYQPAGGKAPVGRVPVIVMQNRTELRKQLQGAPGNGPEQLRALTAHGYAVVTQDRRGTGASFGTQVGFITRDDRADAKAVIEWAGMQHWSTGKVGAMGCSNQGAWQYAVAAEQPKHLVALAPECASPMFFDDTTSQNGVSTFAMGNRAPYSGQCDQPTEPGIPVDADSTGELAKAAAQQHRCDAPFLGQYQANMHRDTENPYLHYAPGMVDSVVMQIDAVKHSKIKFLQIGGWFDASPGGQLQGWQLFGGRVLIGPWLHCQNADPSGFFPDAAVDKIALQLAFFDDTLKGQRAAGALEPPIRYYTMNAPAGTEWRFARSWPLPEQRLTTYYFAEGRSGTIESMNDGVLSRDAPAAADASDAYHPDYSAALFDGKYMLLARYWSGDLSAGIDRKGLTYTLPVLTESLQVTGHPVVSLWVTSSAPDQDFFAILEDVAPDGHATYVTDGKIRGSRRRLKTPPWGDLGTPWHSQMTADDSPLSSTDPAELKFSMTPTSWVFRPGHRVRVSIVNAIGPMVQRPTEWTTTPSPSITVLRDAAHSSSLVLPVIPAG